MRLTFRAGSDTYLRILCYLSVLLVVCCAGISFIPKRSGTCRHPSILKKKTAYSYEAIATGPLTLNPHLFYRSAPSLLQEVVFIKQFLPKGLCFLIGIRGSHLKKELRVGETLYLSVDEKDPSFPKVSFSEERTSYSISPIMEEKGGVLVTASLLGDKGEKTLSLLMQEIDYNEFDANAAEEFAKSPAVNVFTKAKVWGADVLYAQYAGASLSKYRGAVKLEIGSEYGSYYHLVQEGQFLFFNEGVWQVDPIPGPKAIIHLAESGGVNLAVWDESGLAHASIAVLKEKMPSFLMDDLVLSLPKIRGAQTISCVLGKRRLALKKGDWVLKNERGWRILRTAQDIQDCLEHKRKGCLFIIDSLEIKDEKVLVSGKYFDEMRLQYKPIQTSLDLPKKPKKTGLTRKKNPTEKRPC